MDPPAPEPPQRPVLQERHQGDLTESERKQIVSALLFESKDGDLLGKLRHGALTEIARTFHVHPRTIKRIWERACQNYQNPEVRAFRSSPRKKHNVGRKKKWNHQEVRDAVREIPFHLKRSLRDLAAALAIPLTSLHRMKTDRDDPVIMPCGSWLKPLLTPEHKNQRVFYAVSKYNPDDNTFHSFYNSVHVDEKWFFLTEAQLRLYIATDEDAPIRFIQNKDHITKVMFLCAIARPRYDKDTGECLFDGKIGMWPIVEQHVAMRRSVNRERGAIITTPVSCTRDKYRHMMIEKVIPAIKNKWPDRDRDILIQQDGAPAHILGDDIEFGVHACAGNWNIRIETQPTKSPDSNVLDLSFFRALQSLQWKSSHESTIDGLIAQVLRAFREFEPRKIDFGFLTLQTVLDDILCHHGGNEFKISHIGKERLLRIGELPTNIEASDEAASVYRFVMNPPRLIDDEEDDNNGDERPPPQQMIQAIEEV